MSTALLEVRDLSVGFLTAAGEVVPAASGVSLDLQPGRTLGLVGESGCGKSVTLRALLGLVPYPGQVLSGSIKLDGEELLDLSPKGWERVRGADVAMILQDPTTSLNPVFTVGDQVREVLRIKRGLGRAAAEKEAVGLLDRVGIRSPRERLSSFPHELSGGMRQRIMIAMAVASRPKLLLADEPTTALDVTVQAQILELLASLRDELQMGMLIVSHDVGVIAEVCDDVAVMYAGRVVERGAVDDVLDTAQHPYTAGLVRTLAEMESARGRGQRVLQTLGGQPPLLSALPPGCYFEPRCPERTSACSSFDMHLESVTGGSHATACLVRQLEESPS